ASAMRNRSDGFHEQEAASRSGRENPASPRFLQQMLVIFGRLEPEERKLESVLSARFAVASAAVASGLGKDWDDLVGEVDRRIGLEILHDNRHRNRTTETLRGESC